MEARSWELIAMDESAIILKTFLDAIVVEDGQCDRRLANSSGTDQGHRLKVFGDSDGLTDQLAASEKGPRGR